MLISNSKQFIYIHLHKCAGTSIETALSATLRWNDILLGSTKSGEALQHIYRGLFGLYKHSTARETRAVVGDAVWNGYFKFSTVRNPYALAVSQYTYSLHHLLMAIERLKRQPLMEGSFRLAGRYDTWPFNYPGVQALLAKGGVNAQFADFIRAPNLAGWTGFTAQFDQLADANGELIVDQVIKVEELAAQWPSVCERLGVETLPLGRENRSRDDALDYRSFYQDPADQEFVRSQFRQDFERFGYPAEL
jgi:hypothetical protein